jgi:8-oxo-dGTP pyrophosphatase MutT (NUDIX family)
VEQYEYRLYLITDWEGTPENLLPEEHAEIRWLSPDELQSLPVAHPAYLDLFRHALRSTQP